MRRLSLMLSVLWLGACGGPLPNGKEGILSFRAPADIIRSADYGVVIEHEWYSSKGVLGFDVDYHYDFQGTSLEATTTGGLSVESSSLRDSEYLLRLRCGAAHGQREELRVRIHAGWQTRYEDAFDITCWDPNEVTFKGNGPWVSDSLFVGALGVAFVGEQGRVELSRQFRDQYYVELANPEGRLGYPELGGPDRPQFLSQLFFRTQTPGTNAELLLGERRITFPVEVLPDEAWQLQATLDGSSDQTFPTRGKLHSLRATAVLPNGDPVKNLDDCQWIIRSGAADGLPTYKSCYVSASTHGSSAVVCAQTRGKESCVTLPP